ncbi:hypothetical protein Taro_004052 [Colocasia esculenta]|uniref:F-box domain-containing protein n=1 Tax=Colocasia esculenta TaxID=4460 RepID=A0A843TNG4_COLES|nr:hypothetical protein [Colocasia esculenta]
MALECPKAKASLSKESAGRALDEQNKSTHSKNCVSGDVPGPNFTSQADYKSVLLKSASGFQSKKATVESSGSDDSAADSRRSITDLPQALVSEILCRLDAKELGIVSCVSTLLHSLASDNKGWRQFYCERWGPPVCSMPFGTELPEEKAWKDLFIEREFRSNGSWDMSVRIWDRAKLKCLKVLRHGDWVWSLVPRGSTVASTAGRDAYIWDIENGDQIAVIGNAHPGNAYSLARTHSGDLLFTGGGDGAIHLFKLTQETSSDDIKPVATWIPHTAAVHSLAFEFPWLVSCSSDGRLALIDVGRLEGWNFQPKQTSVGLIKNATNTDVTILT